jgi:hypothetical protein
LFGILTLSRFCIWKKLDAAVIISLQVSTIQSLYTGANLDIPRNLSPYFMNSSGTGSAKHDMPPRRLHAGPTPKFVNRGLAAKARPQANKLRKKVLPAIALAAKGP